VIAVIHRKKDVEDKRVVAPEGMKFSVEEIREQTNFQEQFFEPEIELID
jgi:inorganic pyrophosphatase